MPKQPDAAKNDPPDPDLGAAADPQAHPAKANDPVAQDSNVSQLIALASSAPAFAWQIIQQGIETLPGGPYFLAVPVVAAGVSLAIYFLGSGPAAIIGVLLGIVATVLAIIVSWAARLGGAAARWAAVAFVWGILVATFVSIGMLLGAVGWGYPPKLREMLDALAPPAQVDPKGVSNPARPGSLDCFPPADAPKSEWLLADSACVLRLSSGDYIGLDGGVQPVEVCRPKGTECSDRGWVVTGGKAVPLHRWADTSVKKPGFPALLAAGTVLGIVIDKGGAFLGVHPAEAAVDDGTSAEPVTCKDAIQRLGPDDPDPEALRQIAKANDLEGPCTTEIARLASCLKGDPYIDLVDQDTRANLCICYWYKEDGETRAEKCDKDETLPSKSKDDATNSADAKGLRCEGYRQCR